MRNCVARNVSASGMYSPSRASVSRISSARVRSPRPSAATSAKIVVACASGTSAAISSAVTLRASRRTAAAFRSRPRSAPHRRRWLRAAAPAPPSPVASPPPSPASAPATRAASGENGRNSTCAGTAGIKFLHSLQLRLCPRLRNRSGWLRSPATVPGVGSLQVGGQRRRIARLRFVVRPPRVPRGNAASALADPDHALRREQRQRPRVIQRRGQRNLIQIVPREPAFPVLRAAAPRRATPAGSARADTASGPRNKIARRRAASSASRSRNCSGVMCI